MSTERSSATPPPSREHLLRYLRGDLPPAEQHALERRLEEDPLLRDAVEGLSAPGAAAAAAALRSPFAPASPRWPARVLGGGLVVGVIAVTTWIFTRPEPKPQDVRALLDADALPTAPNTDSVLRVVHEEIAQAAAARPEVPQAAPATTAAPARVAERFERVDTALAPVVRDTLARVTPAAPGAVRPSDPEPSIVPVHPPKPSRRLVYLYNLKLVHPKELYGDHPPQLIPAGVSADRENARSPGGAEPPVNVSYLDFMDRAMEAVSKGRAAAALDDLYFLLGQYPDDVNAQFYAGLCCYELGLYPRAQQLMGRAASNRVDTFNEEAAWYGALATEGMSGRAAAHEAYARIAEQQGFYAKQAQARLGH